MIVMWRHARPNLDIQMSHNLTFKVAEWLAETLFAALALAIVWEYRSSDLPSWGSGLGYFCIAVALPLLSTARARRKRTRENRILLAAAYLVLILSLLNFFAAAKTSLHGTPGRASLFWVILISLAYAVLEVLLVTLAFWDEDFRFPLSQDVRKLLSATAVAAAVSWIFAVALAGGGLLQLHASMRESFGISWNVYVFSMMFAALFSGMLGYVLTRSVGLPAFRRRRALLMLCGLLLASALNEYFVRGNWLLFSLSAVAFIGVFFSAWEALAFVSRQGSSQNM
jgi:hypothetical protein